MSDAHEGLVDALHQCFKGATWLRCQTHFRRNVADKTPASLKEEMHKGLDDILKVDDQQAAREAFNEFAAQLEGTADRTLETLELGLEDAIAFLNVPDTYRRRLQTTNMMERLIEKVRRRVKVIRIFPNDESAWRLVGAYLAERYEEWSTKRRYLKMQEYHR